MCINYLEFFCRGDLFVLLIYQSPQVTLAIKTLPANAGDTRDLGSILASGKSPGA